MEFIDKSPEGKRVEMITAIVDHIMESIETMPKEVRKSKMFYAAFCDAAMNLMFRLHKRAGVRREDAMREIEKAWNEYEASLS